MVEVTQEDREAAASIAVLVEMRELIREGRADHHAEPFARHRIAALDAARGDPVARVVEWLRACSLSSAIPDDPAQMITDLADAIERGEPFNG